MHAALAAVGELLEHENEECAVVVLGGTALTLQGLVSRVTRDVDVVAMGEITDGKVTAIIPPDPLPDSLIRAVSRVARDFGLPRDWLNTVVAAQWRTGMPDGFEERLHWRTMGGLHLGLLDRMDLIFFKLFAAADQAGPQSKHYQDLIALEPTVAELDAATKWVLLQDASTAFSAIVREVADHARTDLRRSR